MGRHAGRGKSEAGGGAVRNGVHFSVNVNYFEVWASFIEEPLHIINKFFAKQPDGL
jgi:hypothetical protein